MSKKCTHCNIIVLDDTEYCPFCHHVLQKEENGTHQTEVKNRYPDIAETVRRVSIARRILLYLAVAIGVICLFTNYRTYDGLLWSLIVIYGLIYAVIIVSLFSSEKLGAYGKVGWTSFFALIYTAVIDLVFGFTRWSITYILPSWLIVINAILVIFMIVDHAKFQSYILHEFYIVVMNVVLFILIRVGLLKQVAVAEVALMMSILIFLGILILGGRAAHTEIARRFHI